MTYTCVWCLSVFSNKGNLKRHSKFYCNCYPCSACIETFNSKNRLKTHMKNAHDIIMTARQLAQSAAQIVKPDQHNQPANQGDVQIAPQIFVPDVPAGGSNTVSEDDICMNALDEYEKHELGGHASNSAPVTTSSYAQPVVSSPAVITTQLSSLQCGSYSENGRKNVILKKMNKHPGFRKIKIDQVNSWYFREDVSGSKSYSDFLHSIRSELVDKLTECVRITSIKYNLKSEGTYFKSTKDNAVHTHLYKTSPRDLFPYSNVESSVDEDMRELRTEVKEYLSNRSRYTPLKHIDGMLLCVLNTFGDFWVNSHP